MHTHGEECQVNGILGKVCIRIADEIKNIVVAITCLKKQEYSIIVVGEQIRALRESLQEFPVRTDCRSFAGRRLYNLSMSFFPAGLGLHDPKRKSISTIVLGSDWGNENSFDKILDSSKHLSNSTERDANKMLIEAGFDVSDCFYSNAWPVMRAGGMKEQGHHAMRDDPDFTKAYQEFLKKTIEALSPKLVMSLGIPCGWFLGPFFGDDWKPGQKASPKNMRIKDFDDEPLRVRNEIVFVTATHPSHLNNRTHRKFKDFANEIDLLVYARRKANIPDAHDWNMHRGQS